MTRTESGAARATALRSGSTVAVAIIVMNIATYAFTIIAAHQLGPRVYGAFAAFMNLMLVIAVVQLALQTTAARRIAADLTQARHIETEVVRFGTRVALALGLLLLLLAPVIDLLLKLDSIATALLVGVAAVPTTLFGAQAGILQGERRWSAVAALYLVNGLPRLFIGAALILWQPSEFSAALGVTLAQFVPVLVGWLILRRPDASGRRVDGDRLDSGTITREWLRNSQTLLGFVVLCNADIIVARNVLDEHDAGLYAAGLILTKSTLFLPQFVVVVAYPSLSTEDERSRALVGSLTLVGAMGAVVVLGAWLLSPLAMGFVGGAEYGEIESRLWQYAVLGTALSCLQLLVYSVLARQGQRSTYLVWLAVIAMLAAASTADTISQLLLRVTAVDGTLLLLLLAAGWRELRPADQSRSPQ